VELSEHPYFCSPPYRTVRTTWTAILRFSLLFSPCVAPNRTGKRKPPDLRNDRGLSISSASRTSGCGLGMSGWLAPECGEGEAFVMEGREDRAAVQSPLGAPAAQPVRRRVHG
jgi:hypothetical protein